MKVTEEYASYSMDLPDTTHTLAEEVAAFPDGYLRLEDDLAFQKGQSDIASLGISLGMIRRFHQTDEDQTRRKETAIAILHSEGKERLGVLQTLKLTLNDKPEMGQAILAYLANLAKTLPPPAA